MYDGVAGIPGETGVYKFIAWLVAAGFPEFAGREKSILVDAAVTATLEGSDDDTDDGYEDNTSQRSRNSLARVEKIRRQQ